MKYTIYWNTNIPEARRRNGCKALGISTSMSVNRMADVEIDDSKKDVLDFCLQQKFIEIRKVWKKQ